MDSLIDFPLTGRVFAREKPIDDAVSMPMNEDDEPCGAESHSQGVMDRFFCGGFFIISYWFSTAAAGRLFHPAARFVISVIVDPVDRYWSDALSALLQSVPYRSIRRRDTES